jgi:hypothetical protein
MARETNPNFMAVVELMILPPAHPTRDLPE